MTPLLYSIAVAALLSTASLLAVLFRVSPLAAPLQAIPAFFISFILTVASIATILLTFFWRWLPVHTWDEGKILTIALREGMLLAIAIAIVIVLSITTILTWWVALLVLLVFLLIEMAVLS